MAHHIPGVAQELPIDTNVPPDYHKQGVWLTILQAPTAEAFVPQTMARRCADLWYGDGTDAAHHCH